MQKVFEIKNTLPERVMEAETLTELKSIYVST